MAEETTNNWPSWLPGATLAAAFRSDRAFAWAFALLCVSAISPLLMTPICPMPDLHGHVSNAALLLPTALGQDGAAQYYQVSLWPVPYWSTYAFMALVGFVTGPLFAAKALVAGLLCLLPLATLRLLLALDRDPRLSLWAFLLSWDHNMHAGWHAFLLGQSLTLVLLARQIEARTARRALRSWPLAALVALSHIEGVALAWLAGLACVLFRGFDRRAALRRYLAVMAGTGLIVIPWLGRRFLQNAAAGNGPGFSVDFHSASQKASNVFAFTLDNIPGWQGEVPAALAFLLLIVGPLVLARTTERPGNDPHRWTSTAFAAAALFLYCAGPWNVFGPVAHWYTHARYMTFALLGLLFIPRPRLSGTSWPLLIPGVALAIFLHGSVAQAYEAFGKRVQSFLEIVDSVPRGARLLPLEFQDADPALKDPPLAHIHSNITAIKLGYDPHLYDYHSMPIGYRSGLSIPRISWFRPQGVDLKRYLPYYSHVLVQGLLQDPLLQGAAVPGVRTHLVKEAGIWRLYAIEPE